uniref:Disease resistance R13L4/SHOC-2-like LRR domain-containing protein n=1 Tax=Setaria viridis TaxID=4556 RepID=A0A4V6D1F8_SETVI|nr:hypothetical protein SEVIR_9G299300v2 [Setaria viridis]
MEGTRVEEVPTSIVQLGRLMCLRVDYCASLPTGIGKLTSLEEVSPVLLRRSLDVVEGLGGLTELRVLRIRLWKPSWCLQEALMESWTCWRKVWCRHSAYASCGRWRSSNNFYSPLRLLPAWLNAATVPQLAVLVIQVMELRQEDVDTLGRLPSLRVLCLEPSATRELLTGAMPWLRTLKFQFRVRDLIDLGDAGFEFGFENLGCLEEVTVYVAVHDAREVEAQACRGSVEVCRD